MASDIDCHVLDMDKWRKASIFKLPLFVTELNDKAFTPRAVSFGPYHHDKDNLKPMEENKHLALDIFLKRSGKTKEYCIESLRRIAQDLKDSYSPLDSPWNEDTDKFLELMLLDGCFMLEVLITNDAGYEDWPEYPAKHPIFSQHGTLHMMPFIRRDMLMLENQLPLLVLLKLCDIRDPTEHDVIKLMLDFCHCPNTSKSRGGYKFMHVLDVYRWSLLPESHTSEENRTNSGKGHQGSSNSSIIRCTAELIEAGVKFEKSRTGHLTDVSFNNGKLSLPFFVVDDTTESLFLNLIAYERFRVGVGNEVTSYIFLMDNLIDSEEDVALLRKYGIIQNYYGSHKAVAELFNSLSKDTTLEPNSSQEKVVGAVNAYCRKTYHVLKAELHHTYFTNPWASISVIAAIFLFALTILQTVYSIVDFYKPS